MVVPGLAVDEQWVPATPTPLNGPAYAYAVATYPTTNAEFAAFLNDALLNLSGGRGQEMCVANENRVGGI